MRWHYSCPGRDLPKTPSPRHPDQKSLLGQVRQSFPSLELMFRRLLWVLRTLSALAEMAWLPAFRVAALAKTLPQYNPRRLAKAPGGRSTRIYLPAVTSCASPCTWIDYLRRPPPPREPPPREPP